MRTYATDSAHAAARIVAMVALADGHLCATEVEKLTDLRLLPDQGLARPDWQRVIQDYCEDLHCVGSTSLSPLALDDAVVNAVLDEVRSPSLRRAVFAACEQIADVDGHAGDGESSVLRAARHRWSMQ